MLTAGRQEGSNAGERDYTITEFAKRILESDDAYYFEITDSKGKVFAHETGAKKKAGRQDKVYERSDEENDPVRMKVKIKEKSKAISEPWRNSADAICNKAMGALNGEVPDDRFPMKIWIVRI